jgi:hypothetical protein
MNARTAFTPERLAHLLGLLRPAPAAWVRRAQRVPLESTKLTGADLTELTRRLDTDPTFRQRFDLDPIGATEEAGLDGLAEHLRAEIEELVALAERVMSDEAFRLELSDDPVTTLAAAGIPDEAFERFLESLALPDDVLAKVPEVVAHRRKRPTPRALLLLLALGSTGVANQLRPA